MNRSAALASAAVAVAVAAASVVAVGTASAVGGGHTTHLTLKATVLKSIEPTTTNSVETDALVRAGKKVGFETQSCTFTQGDRCAVTFALAGGVLLGHTSSPISVSNHVVVNGTITGGLGVYAGDKGTLRATVDGIHAKVTITYK